MYKYKGTFGDSGDQESEWVSIRISGNRCLNHPLDRCKLLLLLVVTAIAPPATRRHTHSP
jgi:hypothetical protein